MDRCGDHNYRNLALPIRYKTRVYFLTGYFEIKYSKSVQTIGEQMTTKTKDAVLITVLLIGGIAVVVGDLHRTILAAVWPVITGYLDYLFS